MPRNVAKKLINKEAVSLPASDKVNKKEQEKQQTTTILTVPVILQETVTQNEQQLQQQQEQQPTQLTQKVIVETSDSNLLTKSIVTVTTAITTTTTAKRTTNRNSFLTLNKKLSARTSNTKSNTPTNKTATLYPTDAFETLDSITTKSKTTNTTATTTTAAASATVTTPTSTTTTVAAPLASPTSADCNIIIISADVNSFRPGASTEIYDSDTTTRRKFTRGQRRNKSKTPRSLFFHSTRLATLRKRALPATAVAATLASSKVAPNKNNDKKTKKLTASIKGAAEDPFDAAILNKIEEIELEVKKPSRKRKRYSSCGLITRKRTISQQKNTSHSLIEPTTTQQADELKENSEQSLVLLPTTPTSTKTNNNSNNNNNNNNNAKKRPRIMSLYERRYQSNDDGRGVVPNGYLSSTRTSSASSSVAHSDADAQDITNQYYMSSSGAVGSTSTNAVNALGSNGSSGVVTAAAAINHAPSMATLCNIGNTCYLNSVVYTLRFAPQFLHNLHHLIADLNTIQQNIVRHQRAKSSSLGRGITSVQMENARSYSSKDLVALEQQTAVTGGSTGASVVLSNAGSGSLGSLTQKSSHQLLTERLHELYQSLHRNEVTDSTEPFHADTLLHAIQDVSAIFEGNQQQDAHEFLMCVLNSIRETSQTLIKAVSDCPDVIINGYIKSSDETDASYAHDRDNNGSPANTQSIASNGASNTTSSSSLSTSNITKASFFSRKSKRKEESKNSKNSRMQSPLKEGMQQQPIANSLFYLNTVDLSGGTTTNSSSGTQSNSTSAPATAKSEMDVSPATTPASLLKDKDRLAEKIRELGLDFFSEDFEGVTVSTTKCLSCETITEQKESMIDIAVPVPISGYESAEYTAEKPSAFIQNSCITREYFRGENKYRCEQCTGYTEAIRSISYEVLPRLLVIQLSRFSGGMEKINSYIPTSFTLQCFCAKCCELSEGNKLHIYKLYSVITHVGATMSVGHYIAYTCALDCANEYVNCPKDRRNNVAATQQQQQQGSNGLLGSSERSHSIQASAASVAASALASSGTSLMKKMKFGRSKASSSGDMSKNMKNLNGITTSGSKAITNGIGKLSMNTTCHSLNCCATRLCNAQHTHQQQQQLGGDMSEEALQNGSNHSASYATYPAGYGSTGRSGTKSAYSSASAAVSGADPIWYMCDDDKIKAMTQREFEELLSPARKITVTPYLLFYARFDLQPAPASAGKQAGAASATSSWSNESLQSQSASGITHKM